MLRTPATKLKHKFCYKDSLPFWKAVFASMPGGRVFMQPGLFLFLRLPMRWLQKPFCGIVIR